MGSAEIRAAVMSGLSAQAAFVTGHGAGGGPIFDSTAGTALAHGVAQGTIGWAFEGDFWSGFISGAVGHAVGEQVRSIQGPGAFFARTAIATSAGALTSAATGGDPLLGAVAAMTVHLYNVEAGELGQKVKINPTKAEVRVRFGKYLKGKLSSGSVELSVDVGFASIALDQNGQVSASSGFIKGELNGFSKELAKLGVDIKGLQLTLSNFSADSVVWKIHYSNSFLGIGQHFPSYSGKININPIHYLMRTRAGQAGIKYRAGTTNYVDQCMARNFEGC